MTSSDGNWFQILIVQYEKNALNNVLDDMDPLRCNVLSELILLEKRANGEESIESIEGLPNCG